MVAIRGNAETFRSSDLLPELRVMTASRTCPALVKTKAISGRLLEFIISALVERTSYVKSLSDLQRANIAPSGAKSLLTGSDRPGGSWSSRLYHMKSASARDLPATAIQPGAARARSFPNALTKQ
jgi:hypothetical protein